MPQRHYEVRKWGDALHLDDGVSESKEKYRLAGPARPSPFRGGMDVTPSYIVALADGNMLVAGVHHSTATLVCRI